MDKVYLVGVDTQNDRQFERSMAELAELANACEMEVVGSCVQHTQINKAIYVGRSEKKRKNCRQTCFCSMIR